MKKAFYFIIFSIVFAIGPLIFALIAATIAQLNSCELHEGFVNPCIVLGIDMGGTLYTAGLMPWFSFFTIPVGAILFLIGLIWLFIAWLRRPEKL